MANKHENLTSLFTDIADAIREKTNNTITLIADDFPEAIRAIDSGIDTSDATAVATDIAIGKTAYVNGVKVTGTHECSDDGVEQVVVTVKTDGVAEPTCIYCNNGKIVIDYIAGRPFTPAESSFNVDIGTIFIIINSSGIYIDAEYNWIVEELIDNAYKKTITLNEIVYVHG